MSWVDSKTHAVPCSEGYCEGWICDSFMNCDGYNLCDHCYHDNDKHPEAGRWVKDPEFPQYLTDPAGLR